MPKRRHSETTNNNNQEQQLNSTNSFNFEPPSNPSSSSKRKMTPSFGGGGGRGGRGGGGRGGGVGATASGRAANRQKSNSNNPNHNKPKHAIALVAPPLHDESYILSCYKSLGGRNQPNPKWLENSKGIISNYIVALGESVKYNTSRARVGTFEGYRSTILADGNPPALINLGTPSLPPLSVPILGVGDAETGKDAEKLAALHACIQLGARNLFTSSNLPTRTKGMITPLHLLSIGSSNKGDSYSGVGAGSNGLGSLPGGFANYPINAQNGGAPGGNDGKSVGLSTGVRIGLEEARAFMDFYTNKYNFSKPDLIYAPIGGTQGFSRGNRRGGNGGSWSAALLVDGRRIGMGEAKTKKDAMNKAYLDTAAYLEECDADLWSSWTEKKMSSMVSKGTMAAHVVFNVDPRTDEELRETVWESRDSHLFKRAKAMVEREREKAAKEKELLRHRAQTGGIDEEAAQKLQQRAAINSRKAELKIPMLEKKSQELLERLQDYQTNPRVEAMRKQRNSLPVTSHASSVLAKIATSSVVVVLAATGSGKTTQIPQLILDDAISKGEGARCQIICTQPRRIAAISVAERVAKERGEQLGDSVGYQVRFESKPPKPDGSILFCTTGLFLRRLQSDLGNGNSTDGFLDGITHCLVDEVHERDVDTDLLLFVLRRLLHERRRAGKAEIKVVLMSATIDPVLFTTYFADPDTKRLAPVVEVPGRSFPVEKHFLDETIQQLQSLRLPPNQGGWVFSEKSVIAYNNRELVNRIEMDVRTGRPIGEIDDLDMPYPLLSLIIAWVLSKSDEGHVLVFLPGWDEIQAVRNILLDRNRYPLFNINFNDRQYEIHVLHSTIPIAEQQAVFEPPAPGIRRIVLSTNIAETSVTIPDVVYVVDSAKCKEKRYDPERRLSQLVSAWTGTSNVLQRAGRAGRHRPGEYYGIVSKARFAAMDIHQTVEMLRTDLANTCMHITGLQLPVSVEEVLFATIQPPEKARVHAAMTSLKMVGAIDKAEKLTSLGRVLLQLPVDAAIGKLCLLGSFFRCLDQTLTLAAILTNRDPFLSPPLLKEQADRVKNSWAPQDFRSDPLATLSAFNVWWSMQSRNDYNGAAAFARDNFLSRPTLVMIQKIKEHILSSLDKAGVLRISGGGGAMPNNNSFRRGGTTIIPDSLNVNGESLPLLSSLIATAVAPNFAIRTSEKNFRTAQDKTCAIHPSSVNSRKNEKAADLAITSQKQLYAFAEKSKTGGIGGKGDGQMFLRGTTRLDPLGYMLFGALNLRVTGTGLECDNWLPIVGNVSALDDVERLKDVLDLSLLRVFEGLGVSIAKNRGNNPPPSSNLIKGHREDEEGEGEGDEDAMDLDDPTLSMNEIEDLDRLTTGVVKVLNWYADSRGQGSTANSRPETPAYGGGNGGRSMGQAGPIRGFNTNAGGSASLPVTRIGSPRENYGNNSSNYPSRPGSSSGYHSTSGGGYNAGGGGGGGGGGDWRSRN